MSKKRILGISALVFVLALAAVPCSSWLLTDMAVRAFIANSQRIPSDADGWRIWRYIEGEPWYRPPGIAISASRQADMVRAAIEETAFIGHPCDIIPISMAWRRHHMFPTFPEAISQAMKERKPHVAEMLDALWGSRGEYVVEPYVNVEDALSLESDTACAACFWLSLDTLYEHRPACLRMLAR